MGFLNPWMLIGLAAAGIPVLVHLVFRRRARVMPFPSIVFLRELDREVVRRRRLDQILVMILRIIVVVLFTLFVAKPFLSSRLFSSGGSKAVVIVFDDSYSLQVVEGKSLHEKARDRVLELVSTLGRDDRVGFLVASDRPGGSLNNGALSADHAAVVRHVETLDPGYGTAHLNTAIARAFDILRDSKEPNRAIVVVSDLQSRSWAELARPDGDDNISFLVVNVATPTPPVNVGVTGLDILTTPERELSRTFTFRAVIASFAPKNFSGRFALAPLTGRAIDEGALVLAPRGKTEKSLKLRATTEGWLLGRFLVEDDGLAADNVRYYALHVGRGLRVGVFDPVGEEPKPLHAFDDVFFLEKALDPLGTGYPFEVSTFRVLTRETLEGLDVVLVPSLPELDSAVHRVLKNWLRGGGRLVCFARADVSVHRLADLFEREIAFGQPETGLYRLGSDLLSLGDLLDDVDVYRRTPMEPMPESRAVVLASFADRTPFLIERAVGAGRLVICTAGYDLDSTNLALRHASLPLLYTLLFRLAPEQTARALTVGESIAVDPHWRRIIGPNGEPIALDDQLAPTMPGVYTIHTADGKQPPVEYLAVNVDPSEGDLTRLATRRQLETRVPFPNWALVGTDDDLVQTLRLLERGAPVWNWFLLAAFFVFLVEVYWANKAGRRV